MAGEYLNYSDGGCSSGMLKVIPHVRYKGCGGYVKSTGIQCTCTYIHCLKPQKIMVFLGSAFLVLFRVAFIKKNIYNKIILAVLFSLKVKKIQIYTSE